MDTTENTDVAIASTSATTHWSAVGSMSMGVALLIAAELMPGVRSTRRFRSAGLRGFRKGVRDEPESGGGLLVGAIQFSIMSGGAIGGYLLDRTSITGTFLAGCILLLLSACVVGSGSRLRPQKVTPTHRY